MAPGICLYILFGGVAFISGVMIHRIYLRIDSVRYPITLYGDMCERTVGTWLKYSAFFSLARDDSSFDTNGAGNSQSRRSCNASSSPSTSG